LNTLRRSNHASMHYLNCVFLEKHACMRTLVTLYINENADVAEIAPTTYVDNICLVQLCDVRHVFSFVSHVDSCVSQDSCRTYATSRSDPCQKTPETPSLQSF
jgi:hypothetical protein